MKDAFFRYDGSPKPSRSACFANCARFACNGIRRLLADWMQWQGAKPKARWLAELRPLADGASQDADAGSKDEKGEWRPTGDHSLDKQLRDGKRIVTDR